MILAMSPPSRMLVVATVLFLFESHDLLLFLPRLRALEARICLDYYTSVGTSPVPIDELACKTPLIQSRLAILRGWQVFLDAIPTIALATTWGYIADRIGQRVVLGINCVGSILYSAWYFLVCFRLDSQPVEWIWLSSAGYLLGGGPRLASSLALALVAGEGEELQRSQRLFYTYSAFLLSELLAPSIGSLALALSVWINIALALISLMAGSVLALSMRSPPRDDKPRTPPLPVSGSRATPPLSPVRQLVGAELPQTSPDSGWKARVFRHWRTLLVGLDRSKKYPNSGFALCVIWIGFLICPVRQILVFEVLSPLASQRFNLKISETGFLVPTIALTNLMLFSLIIPWLIRKLTRKCGMSSFHADLGIVKASMAMLVAGCCCISLAGNYLLFCISVIIFAAGFSVRIGLLSLHTALIEPSAVSKAFAFVATLEALGGMLSGVAFQKAFAIGISRGRGWMALPFWIGAALYLIYLVTILSLKEPKIKEEDQQPLLGDNTNGGQRVLNEDIN